LNDTRISADTETRGLGWYNADERAFLTTWSDARGNDHLAHQDDARAMAAFWSDVKAADEVVFHNAPFDVHQLRESENGKDILALGKPIIDTLQLAPVADPERRFAEGGGYKLKDLGTTYVDPNAKDTEDEIKLLAKQHGIKLKSKGGYHALWLVEPEAMEAYAKADTRTTLDLLPKLEAKVTDRARPVWELERKVQPHLIRAEARGVMVDQEKVLPLQVKHTAARDAAYEAVVTVLGADALGDPDDPDSKDEPEALREALLAHGVPLHRLTKGGGGLAVNAPALAEFASAFPVIQALTDYRRSAKFLSTYIGPMLGREVVHPSYNQQGAWTGRMSCSRPNMQNLPVRGEGSSELREMFVPRPGHVFVISDFDQIELRLLAYYLNDPGFIEQIEGGIDVFAEAAALIAPIVGYDAELGTDPAGYRKGTPGADRRSDAKNKAVYPVTYGVGAAKISDLLGLPPGPPRGENDWAVQRGYMKATDPSYPDGKALIAKIKSWMPGYDKLMGNRTSRIKQQIQARGHIHTIMGRRQAIGRGDDGKYKEYIGLNALIQGSAADILKQAVINVAEATAHLGALPVLFVHDEIGSEVPIEHADEALRLQDEAMKAAHDLRPRLDVEGCIAADNYAQGK
jgi:DNA polymerase I-like protein with 3'-5' exonuclease and polymerase domains